MQREAIPAWATDEPVQQHSVLVWTERQKPFILDLIAKKDWSHLNAEGQQYLKEIAAGERVVSKKKASELIEKLLAMKDKPKSAPTDVMAERFAFGVPAGRYAVEADNGELRFYHVWVSRDGKRLNVYVAHGPDESDLKYQKTVLGVLNKIKTVGIRQAAIRYGMEIGSCSNCGRRLTNHISRALGIGPVCGGRMFDDGDWKAEVKAARQSLKDRGINPDAEVE